MTTRIGPPPTTGKPDTTLSLYRLLAPQVLANPYPLYDRLRTEAPVHWDPFLHAWVVTRYADVVTVLHDVTFSAHRTPTPEYLAAMGLAALSPIAQVMVQQMLFMDPPAHTRLRSLAAKAFTPRRVDLLKPHIQEIVDSLLDRVQAQGRMDVIADLANPLPAIVTAELLGVPTSDCDQLKAWSADFATMLGNFEHNPDHAPRVRRSLEEMTAYFRAAIRRQAAGDRRKPEEFSFTSACGGATGDRPVAGRTPNAERQTPSGRRQTAGDGRQAAGGGAPACGEGLLQALVTAEHEGDRLSEDEVIANVIITMVGGQETTTSMIGNGLLTLLHHPDQWQKLRADPALIPDAIEEMLRYESPIQHTARMTAHDLDLGGQRLRQRQAVIAVLGAANRDPERFPDPDRFDIGRPDNRHVAFGWAGHFCFGAPLARMEGRVVFETLLRRMPHLTLEPRSPTWQENLCYRGLTALPVRF